MANGAVQQASQAFNVDSQAHTETVVMNLMKAPIDCVGKLQPSPNQAVNGGAAQMCGVVNSLLAKYPFAANSSVMAAVPEADAALSPDTGLLWSTVKTKLQPIVVQQGAQYAAAPTAPAPVNPRFLTFLNRAAHVSSELYPNGAKSAAFSFNLRFIPGNGVSSATFVMDGQRMAPASNTQTFTWTGASAQNASLLVDNLQALPSQGTWSVFQLVRSAQITRTAGGYRLDYVINNAITVQGRSASGTAGATRMATFELSGPGADFLAGEGFGGATCVLPLPK
jgi:type VI secretion system protein ImpL